MVHLRNILYCLSCGDICCHYIFDVSRVDCYSYVDIRNPFELYTQFIFYQWLLMLSVSCDCQPQCICSTCNIGLIVLFSDNLDNLPALLSPAQS